MEIDFNWFAILAGAATAMISGMIWYNPKVFGAKWMKSAELKQKDIETDQGKGMFFTILRALFLSFSIFSLAYVTNYFYSDQSFLFNAFRTGLFVGIPIVGMTMLMHDTFEKRPEAATKINILYEIITILLMSVVIGLIAG
jgi:MFS family permease